MRDRDPKVVRLARFRSRHEAELARGYLEDAGIPAVLSADDGGGSFGLPVPAGVSGFATLHVREPDLERAREVLGEAGFGEGG